MPVIASYPVTTTRTVAIQHRLFTLDGVHVETLNLALKLSEKQQLAMGDLNVDETLMLGSSIVRRVR